LDQNLIFAEKDLAVADNVLEAEDFSALGQQLADSQYVSVHPEGRWHKTWRLWDGAPLRGGQVSFDPLCLFGYPGPVYPTASPLDALIDAVRALARAYPALVGAEGSDWVALYLSPWIYPAGSALSLHWDKGGYTGAFSFYAHPLWGSHWGGELVVMPAQEPPATYDTDQSWMRESGSEVRDSGIGLSISPRPNRLVLVGPLRPHRITRVEAQAGSNLRLSVSGFFLPRPSHAR
jgi:hypothetical protein